MKTTINCFYTGTNVIDYSMTIEQIEGYEVLVTCEQEALYNESFPCMSAQDFIVEFGADYLTSDYEVLSENGFYKEYRDTAPQGF